MTKEKKKLISLVVPVLNEEENIDLLYRAVNQIVSPLSARYDFEMVFTDNHSTDRTFEKLQYLAQMDKRIRVIRFSRNFGYQRSIYTGYVFAKGDAAIQLDCDLQDPPELIPEFIRLWEAGYKVVYGVRSGRKEGWWIENVRKAFYRIIDLLSEDYLPHDAGDFRLLDRRLLNELKEIEDYQPYLRGIIATMGFNQIGIPYSRSERKLGKSKFRLGDMIRLAVDGILNHSILPLRIATYIGIIVSVMTFGLSVAYFISKLISSQPWPAGFATTSILLLLSVSINALFLGIIGEYLGRIYQQVKKRPITIIENLIENEI